MNNLPRNSLDDRRLVGREGRLSRRCGGIQARLARDCDDQERAANRRTRPEA
jgi:hypothetical protein